jgi:hypothetical protein
MQTPLPRGANIRCAQIEIVTIDIDITQAGPGIAVVICGALIAVVAFSTLIDGDLVALPGVGRTLCHEATGVFRMVANYLWVRNRLAGPILGQRGWFVAEKKAVAEVAIVECVTIGIKLADAWVGSTHAGTCITVVPRSAIVAIVTVGHDVEKWASNSWSAGVLSARILIVTLELSMPGNTLGVEAGVPKSARILVVAWQSVRRMDASPRYGGLATVGSAGVFVRTVNGVAGTGSAAAGIAGSAIVVIVAGGWIVLVLTPRWRVTGIVRTWVCVVTSQHLPAGQAGACLAGVVHCARIAVVAYPLCCKVHAPHLRVARILRADVVIVTGKKNRPRNACSVHARLTRGARVSIVARVLVCHVRTPALRLAHVVGARIEILTVELPGTGHALPCGADVAHGAIVAVGACRGCIHVQTALQRVAGIRSARIAVIAVNRFPHANALGAFVLDGAQVPVVARLAVGLVLAPWFRSAMVVCARVEIIAVQFRGGRDAAALHAEFVEGAFIAVRAGVGVVKSPLHLTDWRDTFDTTVYRTRVTLHVALSVDDAMTRFGGGLAASGIAQVVCAMQLVITHHKRSPADSQGIAEVSHGAGVVVITWISRDAL